jgi:soluble lytic murein transglycosylase
MLNRAEPDSDDPCEPDHLMRDTMPPLLLLLLCLVASPAAAQMYVWTDADGNLHFTDQPRHAGFAAYEPKQLQPRAGRHDPSWLERDWAWDHEIRSAARETGVSPALVKAVIHVESGFDPDAISRVGAGGLMQLMPATARDLGVRNAFDPRQNIRGGARYLKHLIERFEQLDLALAAYNAGPSTVSRYGGVPPYRETRAYVKNVTALYKRYRRKLR